MGPIPTFEAYSSSVGIHCTKKVINGGYYGRITDEYYGMFESVLEKIKGDYPQAKPLLKKIEGLEGGLNLEDDDATELVFEIESFFSDNSLEWIFVSTTGRPMTKYGDVCYDVYFDGAKTYKVADELTAGAVVYVYDSAIVQPRMELR